MRLVVYCAERRTVRLAIEASAAACDARTSFADLRALLRSECSVYRSSSHCASLRAEGKEL